jgi:digeranylgeranylglycerophospholipid reductase
MAMENNFYDLIIVGAGPAGLQLARELVNSKYKILILDRKKSAGDVQYNTAGSFINPKQWQLPEEVLHPIHKMMLFSKNERVEKQGLGYVINRRKLLNFLERECRKNPNLEIEYSAEVRDAKTENSEIKEIYYFKRGRKITARARIYADCSGTSAVLGNMLGLAQEKPLLALGIEYVVPLKEGADEIDLFIQSSLKGGYGWIFPLNNSRAIVGYGTLEIERFPIVEKAIKSMWSIPRVAERCKRKPYEKNIGLLRTGAPLERLAKNNLIIIGDTALQANPLVGEGIRFAMDSARMAAKWVRKALEKNRPKLLQNYTRDWKRKYYRKYWLAFEIQNRLRETTSDDNFMDRAVKGMEMLSNHEFCRLLSGDVTHFFMFRLRIKRALKKKINRLKKFIGLTSG